MARKFNRIKDPIILDGVEVRDIKTLREHFNIETLIEYSFDGKLEKWLRERYYYDEADEIAALKKDDPELEDKLYEIFEVEPPLDPEEIAWRQERMTKLKYYTDDENILAKIDDVAFNQEDLSYLLDENVEEIYLCGGVFTIPLKIKNKKYIGIGDAVAEIHSNAPIDFDALNIRFENIEFNPEYEKILASVEKIEPVGNFEPIKPIEPARRPEPARQPEFLRQPEPIRQPEPVRRPEPVRPPEPARRPEPPRQYEPPKYIEPEPEPSESPEDLFALGAAAEAAGSYEVAKDCFEQAAQMEHYEAMNHLAGLYYYGRGTHQDFTRAFELFLKAAKAGDTTAMNQVAGMYKNGEGVRKDFDKAIYWYREAANTHTHVVNVNNSNSNANAYHEPQNVTANIPANVQPKNKDPYNDPYSEDAEEEDMQESPFEELKRQRGGGDDRDERDYREERDRRDDRERRSHREETRVTRDDEEEDEDIIIEGNTAQTTLKIINKTGVHAHPASHFVQTASKFKSKILIFAKGKKGDAKSILMIMSLGLSYGTEIKLVAEGSDAVDAIKTLRDLVNDKFGEE